MSRTGITTQAPLSELGSTAINAALCCVYLTAAVVVEGAPKVKKANGNFFLATHPKLIEIMDSQGLSWATSYLRAVKGERVGLELMLGELMARGVVKSGNIKDYVGEPHHSLDPARLVNHQDSLEQLSDSSAQQGSLHISCSAVS